MISFPARRPGTCSTCGLPFAVGEKIRFSTRHLLVHHRCPEEAFFDLDAAEAPEQPTTTEGSKKP